MNANKKKPEVLDTIIHEHATLREKVNRIHTVLSGPAPDAQELESLLREFLNVLVVHFTNEEEESGFFDEVVSRAPQFTDQAARLCVEHRELLRETNELAQFAAAGSPSMPWWRELSSRCHVLSKKLMQHESEESRLIERAFREEVDAGFCS